MKRESQRVSQTKKKIRDAFFELYAAKKIERISIKEIMEIAHLHRGTFYIYYMDKYDLLEKTEDELIKELSEYIRAIATMLLRNETVFPCFPPADFFLKYGAIFRTLLGITGDPKFIDKLKIIIKNTFRELLQKEQFPQSDLVEYIMEYVLSAQIGVISYWLQNDMSLPLTELAAMVEQILQKGPINVLKIDQEAL